MRVDAFLEESAARFPDKTALVCGERHLSYRDVDEQANRLAHALIASGVEPGDRVAIALDNSVEAVVSLFAVLKAGAAFFIVSPRVSTERLARLVADSGARLVMTRSSDFDAPGALTTPPPKRHGDGDLAALVYTSGSTGAPKGVMLTHGNLTFAAAAINTYLENTPDDVILNVLPLAFTYGLGQVTTAFRTGATLVLERSAAFPRAIVDTLARERVTGWPIVPTLATMVLQLDLSRHTFPHLRYITSAAAALTPAKVRQLRRAFPGAQLVSMYGQTECQRVSWLPTDRIDTHPESVGRPLPGTDAYVVDERGRRVPPGVIGELVVRGPHVMKGYWNQPDATARALRPDAADGALVLHTGDLFRMDSDGLLYFVSRTDDVVKTRGEKVAPRAIEDVIAQLPGIAEVAVYGVPDDVLGEAIAASVTLVPGEDVSVDRIRRHCLERLDAWMVPKTVSIRDALPTTSTGKVSRRALRDADDRAGRVCA